MIFVDTNVVSELMQAEPNQNVLAWANSLQASDVRISTIVAAEIRAGVARLPDGKRKSSLQRRAEGILDDLGGYFVGFSEDHSISYAHIALERRRQGLHFANIDSLIAATALSHSASLATRNVSDFSGVGLELINPWDFNN